MQIAAGNFIGITKRDTTVGGADTELGTRGSASAVSEADTVEREKERHREKRGQFGSDMNRYARPHIPLLRKLHTDK